LEWKGSIISLLGISALKVRKLSLDTENLATSAPKISVLALVISHTGLLAAVCFIPEQEQYVFDNLWNKAILAEERREEQSATKRRY
jgi:hypothetical protein